MKRIYYIIFILGLAIFPSCQEDLLDTNPTDRVSGPVIFETAESAEAAINGIYRMLYTAGWSQNWTVENMGITAVTLVSNLMGEDHVMDASGSGWFFFDYAYDVRGDYIHKSGRAYSTWNLFYTIISNTNYIIANEETIGGDPGHVQSIVGQAYAMRALSYFYLIQFYQHTFKGNENAPGVPLYTEPTTSDSEGKGRGTVQQVYDQINADISYAIGLFESANFPQKHPSHVDYYVANGFKARIDLVQERFQEAADAAQKALSKPGLSRALPVNQLGRFNNAKLSNVLWGLEIIPDQTSGWASFFSHLDADASMYGSRARHLISSWLFNQIPETDSRLNWFRGEVPEGEQETGTSIASYVQVKFAFADVTNQTGDYILLRSEELILIQAEALARLDRYNEARELMLELGSVRDQNYATRLAGFTDSKAYNTNTTGSLTTLMDEILFQRRVELWGENGRLWDIQRLKLGFTRNFEGSNHSVKLATKDTGPASKEFISPIPQSEFDGNPNMSADDQNPL
jgi:starch-binding outer membrane protein, SusD/RagB family